MKKKTNLARGERLEEYGSPNKSLAGIAQIWSALLDVEVSPEQVSLCMIGLKLVRENYKHKADNLDDIDGYTELIRMLKEMNQ